MSETLYGENYENVTAETLDEGGFIEMVNRAIEEVRKDLINPIKSEKASRKITAEINFVYPQGSKDSINESSLLIGYVVKSKLAPENARGEIVRVGKRGMHRQAMRQLDFEENSNVKEFKPADEQ